MHELLKSRRIEMIIVEFQTDRPKRARRGSPAIPEGTTLFALYYRSFGGYYPYSYEDKTDAEQSIYNMKLHQTDNEFYYPWNVVHNIQDTKHVSVRKVKK